MINNKNLYLILIVLTCTIIYSFFFPKVKYVSLKILPELKIPFEISGWQGKDVSQNINKQDMRYNFISDVFARVYTNSNNQSMLFLILDAGNFHHPKVCFNSSGFKTKEMSEIKLNPSAGKILKAHSLYVEKGYENYLLIYWICIDKEITEWTGQKIKELWYSLFNKKKSGLMMRLDIPVRNGNIENSINLGKKFIEDLGKILPEEQADYLFGK